MDSKILNCIATDASTIMGLLLVYKLAAKNFTEEEIDVILNEGQKVLVKHLCPPNGNQAEITETILGVTKNVREIILSMKDNHNV